jgi:hypothetical protein
MFIVICALPQSKQDGQIKTRQDAINRVSTKTKYTTDLLVYNDDTVLNAT